MRLHILPILVWFAWGILVVEGARQADLRNQIKEDKALFFQNVTHHKLTLGR